MNIAVGLRCPGTVYSEGDRAADPGGVWVDALDASTGAWTNGIGANGDGTYSLTLPPGDYRVFSLAATLRAGIYGDALSESGDLITVA
ncbi:MAG: hypothetical protein IPK19_29920 [Chloroflexi bacterium]|nr:hypothetical protein [Chloroflexota bacterium]